MNVTRLAEELLIILAPLVPAASATPATCWPLPFRSSVAALASPAAPMVTMDVAAITLAAPIWSVPACTLRLLQP